MAESSVSRTEDDYDDCSMPNVDKEKIDKPGVYTSEKTEQRNQNGDDDGKLKIDILQDESILHFLAIRFRDLSTSQTESDSIDVGQYNTTHPKSGKVIIINIEENENGQSTRPGSAENVAMLESAFKDIGMEVDTESKKTTADEILEFLAKCSGDLYEDYAMFVCVVMSHGNDNKIYTSRQGVLIDMSEIVYAFHKTPSLESKPKIFIFQACRGGTVNFIRNPAKKKFSKNHDGDPEESNLILSDCLIIQSTIQGYVSHRKWFIGEFCRVLNAHWELDEICTLLTRVNSAVSKLEKKKKPDIINKQMSTFTSMLKKKLYFPKKNNSKSVSSSPYIAADSNVIPCENILRTERERERTTQDLGFYNLDFPKLGKVVIININKFYEKERNKWKINKELTEKRMTDDVEKLTEVFQKTMGMDLETYGKEDETDLTNILDFIDECIDENFDNYAMFVVVFMSYGDGNVFYLSKRQATINMDQIIHTTDNSSKRQGKPKIFIFHQTRCNYFSDGSYEHAPKTDISGTSKSPDLADCIIINSSPPAYLSTPVVKDKPSFIDELCKVLKSYWKKEDIYTMLTKVNDTMNEQERNSSSTLTSSFESTLTRTLYFSMDAYEIGFLRRFLNVLIHYWLKVDSTNKWKLVLKEGVNVSSWFKHMKQHPVTLRLEKFGHGVQDIDFISNQQSSQKGFKDAIVFTSILYSYSMHLLEKEKNSPWISSFLDAIKAISCVIPMFLAYIPWSISKCVQVLQGEIDNLESKVLSIKLPSDDQNCSINDLVLFDVDILCTILGLSRKFIQNAKTDRFTHSSQQILVVDWLKTNSASLHYAEHNTKTIIETEEEGKFFSLSKISNESLFQGKNQDESTPLYKVKREPLDTTEVDNGSLPVEESRSESLFQGKNQDESTPLCKVKREPSITTEADNGSLPVAESRSESLFQGKNQDESTPLCKVKRDSVPLAVAWKQELTFLGFTSWKASLLANNIPHVWKNHQSPLDLATAHITYMFQHHPLLKEGCD